MRETPLYTTTDSVINSSQKEYTDLLAILRRYITTKSYPNTFQAITNLPKADIHVHLPGTISPKTAWTLGVRNRLIYWNKDRWEGERLNPKNPHKFYTDIFANFETIKFQEKPELAQLQYNIIPNDFASFDSIMATVQGHRHPPGGIQNEGDLRIVLKEFLKLCLRDHIYYTEVQQNIRIAYSIYPQEDPKEARYRLYSVLLEASELFKKHGVIIRFINCFNKTNVASLHDATVARSKEAADWLEEVNELFPGLFVGLQSAGSESCPSSHPRNLLCGYKKTMEMGLGCEAHAGEGTGYQYLLSTIDTLPLHRVAHGFQAYEDATTMQKIKDLGLTLVMAPMINLTLGASLHTYHENRCKNFKYPITRVDQHPFFPLLRKHKMSIVLSSDNPCMAGRSLNETLLYLAGKSLSSSDSPGLVSKQSPMTIREILDIVLTSIAASFGSLEDKISFLQRLKIYLENLESYQRALSKLHLESVVTESVV